MPIKHRNPAEPDANARRAAGSEAANAMKIGLGTPSANPANLWNAFFWPTENRRPNDDGRLLFHVRNLVEATESLRSFSASRAFKEKGLEKFSSGKYDEAVELLTKSIDYFPFGEAYFYRAMAKITSGLTVSGKKDLQKAVEFFRIEIDYAPDCAELRLNMGRSHFLLGDFERAAVAWETLANAQPENAKICEDIGVARASCGNFSGAMRAFQTAVARDERMGNSYCFMGTIWMEHYNQYNEAIINFSKAILINPKQADAWCGRAEARLKIGQFNDAYDDARTALAINPNNRNAQDILLKTADEIGLVDQKGWALIEKNIMH